jgi:hypothetical protein
MGSEDLGIRSQKRQVIEDLLNAGGADCRFPARPGSAISTSVLSGGAVALTVSATVYQVAALVLPAGTWDVDGFIGFLPDTATSITGLSGSSSIVTAQLVSGQGFTHRLAAIVPGINAIELPLATVRYALPNGGTVYLNASALFTVSTVGAYGRIQARPVVT